MIKLRLKLTFYHKMSDGKLEKKLINRAEIRKLLKMRKTG